MCAILARQTVCMYLYLCMHAHVCHTCSADCMHVSVSVHACACMPYLLGAHHHPRPRVCPQPQDRAAPYWTHMHTMHAMHTMHGCIPCAHADHGDHARIRIHMHARRPCRPCARTHTHACPQVSNRDIGLLLAYSGGVYVQIAAAECTPQVYKYGPGLGL